MDVLDQLAVALGFATLAGINLYLTAFVTGLAVKLKWVILSESYADLSVLGETPVLLVTGALLLTELFADKIPWVDSVWDAFHSLVRPVGGGLLALSALGTTQPEYDVIIALVAGGATMMSHGFKSGTRLAVNHSPEPFSNGIVSVAEDIAVIGGLSLMAVDPKILGVVCIVFLAFAVYSFPKIYRRLRGFYWLLFHNTMGDRRESSAGHTLSPEEYEALVGTVEAPEVQWNLPVLTSRTKQLSGTRPWLMGQLVALEGSTHPRLVLVARRWRRYRCVEFPDVPLQILRDEGLLSEKLSLYEPGGNFQVSFRLPRSKGALARRITEAFRERSQMAEAGNSLPVGS